MLVFLTSILVYLLEGLWKFFHSLKLVASIKNTHDKLKDIVVWSILIPEQINRLIFIHHILIIGLTIAFAILWVKVRNLSKKIKECKDRKHE